MAFAPAVDVIPVDVIGLNGDHVASVVLVFSPCTIERPSEFRDDDILRRGKEYLATEQRDSPSPRETFLVMGIVADEE